MIDLHLGRQTGVMAAARAAEPRPPVTAGQVPLPYLDANVLLPEYLRAVILDLADAQLVRVHWGAQVLAGVQRNLLKPKFNMSAAAVDELLRDMRKAFPDALVLGSEALESEPRADSRSVELVGRRHLGILSRSSQYSDTPSRCNQGNRSTSKCSRLEGFDEGAARDGDQRRAEPIGQRLRHGERASQRVARPLNELLLPV